MAAGVTAQELHARYQGTFGRVGGYLPRNPLAIDEFQRGLAQRAADLKDDLDPAVREFAEMVHSDGIVRMYVSQMLQEVPEEHRHVRSVDELIQHLNVVVGWAPSYNRDLLKQIFLPMSALFGYMRLTPSGAVVFRNQAFGERIDAILGKWCTYLDSAESAHVLNTRDWFSQPAVELDRLYGYECWDHRGEEHWGFPSFNAFFHRAIKKDFRPLAGKDDPSSAFVGGDVYQAFLSVNSYHRWHVPVDGTIEHLEIVKGYPFSHVESASPGPAAFSHSQGYRANIGTRGLAFIRTGSELGHRVVCAVVIGMEEVSSISWAPGVEVGATVSRGQELGWFSYGGSSMALVFQQGVVDEFTVPVTDPGRHPDDGPTVFVNSQIARAR
ncbi:phophatidylserine decarboxylase associated domain-containing protein [Streptomyces roseifaciens]